MKSKKLMSLLLATLISSSVFLSPNKQTTASVLESTESSISKSPYLSESELNYLIDWFTLYEVPDNIQQELITKFNNQLLWDSMKEDSVPIKEEILYTQEGACTKFTYGDGSILVIINEIISPDTRAINASITGGRIVSQSSYHTHIADKKIVATIGVATASFLMEYIVNSGENNDELRKVYTPMPSVVGGTIDKYADGTKVELLKLTNQYESAYDYATAEYTFDYTLYNGAGSGRFRLFVNVGNNTIRGYAEIY